MTDNGALALTRTIINRNVILTEWGHRSVSLIMQMINIHWPATNNLLETRCPLKLLKENSLQLIHIHQPCSSRTINIYAIPKSTLLKANLNSSLVLLKSQSRHSPAIRFSVTRNFTATVNTAVLNNKFIKTSALIIKDGCRLCSRVATYQPT